MPDLCVIYHSRPSSEATDQLSQELKKCYPAILVAKDRARNLSFLGQQELLEYGFWKFLLQ
jgi:hypothetical protein